MTQFKTSLSLLLGCLLLTIEAKSEILRWPQLCLSGKLTIRNSGRQNLRAWIQKFSDGRRSESEIAVRAFSRSDFNISAKNSQDRFTLMHFADPQKISAIFQCEKMQLSVDAQSLEGGVMTFEKSDLIENKIWLQNLYSDNNTVQIELLDSTKRVVLREILILHSFEQTNYKTTVENTAWHSLRIWADNRFTAFRMVTKGATGPALLTSQQSKVDTQAAYFLVGPREGIGDTFIARISDPAMLARARELVQHPEYEKMLFASIQKGHQGFNRNWSKSAKSFWSWSVSEITNFADLGSTACNGLPQQVEDDVDLWVQNPGKICFWNYRIKKEISAQEITQEAP